MSQTPPPPPESPGKGSAPSALDSATQFLTYTLSLPERAVRSSIGLTAGAAREAATLLIPRAFQSGKTYEVVIRNSLNFLAEDVGGARGPDEPHDGAETPENYVARKAVGNFMDLTSLATLHLSPVWLLAIVSDVAYGSRSIAKELAGQLAEKGLIDETSSIHHVDDILEALQKSTGQAASLFDTPPLSVAQLQQSLRETKDALTKVDYTKVLPESELKSYWNEMNEIANRDGVDVLEISGAMTLASLRKISTIGHGTISGVTVLGGLFNREVLGHYSNALTEIREKGFYTTLQDVSAPYITAVWSNFSTGKKTLTEEVLSGRPAAKLWNRLVSWVSGADKVRKDESPGL